VSRVCIVCPGRGSYTESSLGSLPADHRWVLAAEEARRERGLESLLALDGAGKFEPARHLRPSNVSPLIYLVSMLDGARALEEHQAACIVGNSMGWYTTLALGGALGFADGLRLVQEMSLLQEEGGHGGQVIYPKVDADWRPDPERGAAIEEALATSNGELFPSIDLGGYAVLAGSPRGVAHALSTLGKTQLGKTTYPFRLAQHGPYHTRLASGVAERARFVLADLDFRKPRTTLIDGRGIRFSPWSTDLDALRDYTLGAQVDTPYDFTRSLRVALREYAPERLVLPGPGNTLGGVCGQVLAAEGWRGIRSKADFERVQAGDSPLVDSMRR